MTGDVDETGHQTTPWGNEAEIRTYNFVGDVEAYEGGGKFVDGEDGAAIQETEESLQRLRTQRRESVVKNVNRPAERRKSLASFQTNNELPN